MLPQIPDPMEADKMPSFAISSKASPCIAREAMNRDMVKPIPHNQPAPKICPQDNSEGFVVNPILAETQANSDIPSGLPTKRPRTTPTHTGCFKAAEILPRIRTPPLVNAKSGITTKLTQGCK